jgi:hypothetical protein
MSGLSIGFWPTFVNTMRNHIDISFARFLMIFSLMLLGYCLQTFCQSITTPTRYGGETQPCHVFIYAGCRRFPHLFEVICTAYASELSS